MSGRSEFTVVRRPLRWEFAPVEALRLVRNDAHPVALFGTWAGGTDVVASEPARVRSGPGQLADVFDPHLPPVAADASFADASFGNDASFGGGWIGYLGYSAGGEALAPAGPRRLPPWWFGWYDNVLVRERATGEWFSRRCGRPPARPRSTAASRTWSPARPSRCRDAATSSRRSG
jgi:hypothetical protein